MQVRVLLADDHQIVREGLRALLSRSEDITVAGEAANGREVLRCVRECRPHVVVMDVGMPELNGVDATRQLSAEDPNLRIIALSMHRERRFVIEMIRAGARGYVLKDSAADELALAIRYVAAGRVYLSPDVAEVVADELIRLADDPKVDVVQQEPLTQREREVLQLLAEGNPTKIIAKKLQLSAKTVESHRQNLMNKLNLRSIAELTKYAVREGLTSLDV